jgi:hypothetical protein
VELLKHPGCVGTCRKVVLASLGEERGRPFAHLWEAVDWLRSQRPAIDLTAPPALRAAVPAARPNPGAP